MKGLRMSDSNQVSIKGKLNRLFADQDLEGVIEYCRENNLPLRSILKEYRDRYNVSVEETNRVRTRLFRRKDYREGRLQNYVKNRHEEYDFTDPNVARNPNGTRRWKKSEYKRFLDLQEKGASEVEIAQKLKTNLRMVKYLRLKRRLVLEYLSTKRKKKNPEELVELMDRGDRTLRMLIDAKG